MKRIAWTVETLRIKRNELVKRKLEIKKLNLDDDLLKELLNIEVALEDLDEIIFELENENSFEIIKPKEALKDINKVFNRNKHFISQITIFNSIVNKQSNLLQHCNETKPLQISKNDYLSLVFDFFRSTDKLIFEAFLKNFKDEYKFLNFENYNIGTEDTNYGLTYSVRGINLSFLKIFDHKDLETILTISHEYVHASVFSLNQKRLQTEKSLNFSELEPYFFEFLAEDYFEKTLNNKSFINTRLNRYSISYNMSEDILDMHPLCQTYNKTDIRKHIKIRELAAKLGVEKQVLNELVYIDYENNFNCILSLLIAIELYNLYLEDPELAFYKLKKIIYLTEKNNIQKEILNLGLIMNNSSKEILEMTLRRKGLKI